MWSIIKQTKLFAVLSVTLLMLVSVWFLGQIRNDAKEYRYIGKPTDILDTISIAGEGKVTAIPDIATIDVGVMTEAKEVSVAQKQNTEKMNAITKKVKDQGVEDKDIQTTNYQIYPQYDYYPNGRQQLRGYQVTQSARIKIRDLSKSGAILSLAGEAGANQVSGVSFTIDDPEALKQQAREKALDNARQKAKSLADHAGVKLGKIVSFSESDNGSPPYPIYARAEALGVGGGLDAMPSPKVESGSLDIQVNVDVSYEIL